MPLGARLWASTRAVADYEIRLETFKRNDRVRSIDPFGIKITQELANLSLVRIPAALDDVRRSRGDGHDFKLGWHPLRQTQ